jgi:hypothetical protein
MSEPLKVEHVKELVLRHGADFAVVVACFGQAGTQWTTYGRTPEDKVCASDLSEELSDCVNRGLCPSLNPATGPATVNESFKLEAGRIKAENERLRDAALRLCRELQSPAMEYLNKSAQDAWSDLFNLVNPK